MAGVSFIYSEGFSFTFLLNQSLMQRYSKDDSQMIVQHNHAA